MTLNKVQHKLNNFIKSSYKQNNRNINTKISKTNKFNN